MVRLYSGGDTRYLNFYGPARPDQDHPVSRVADRIVETARVDLKARSCSLARARPAPEQRRSARHLPDRLLRQRHGSQRRGDRRDRVRQSSDEPDAATCAVPRRSWHPYSVRAPCGVARPHAAGLYAAGAVFLSVARTTRLAQYLFTEHALLVPLGIPLLVQAAGQPFSQPSSSGTAMSGNRCRGRWIPAHRPNSSGRVPVDRHRELRGRVGRSWQPRDLGVLDERGTTRPSRSWWSAGAGLMMGRAGDSAMCVWTAPAERSGSPEFSGRRPGRRGRPTRGRAPTPVRRHWRFARRSNRFNERHATPLRTRIGCTSGRSPWGRSAASTT